MRNISRFVLAGVIAFGGIPALAQGDLIKLETGTICSPATGGCIAYDAESRVARMSGFGGVIISEAFEVKPGHISESGFEQIQRAINKRTGMSGR